MNGVLAAVIKLVMSTLIGNLFVYMAEIFPSVFRGIGCSLVTVIGRLGGVIAPFAIEICKNLGIMP